MKIRLFNKETISECQWPSTLTAKQAQGLLVPFLMEGVNTYISNVSTQFYILQVDEWFLPVTVNDKEYMNSYVASNYCAVPLMDEWRQRQTFLLKTLMQPLVKTASVGMQMAKVNRIVIVNNWLFSCNLWPRLNQKQLDAVVALLQATFPDHAILIRHLDAYESSEPLEQMKKAGFQLVPVRQIYFYDPARKDSFVGREEYHHRRDFKLIKTHGYEVVEKEQLEEKDYERLISLYQFVYMKYTALSPHYTPQFLAKAFASSVLDCLCLKKEGKIDGMVAIRSLEGKMNVPLLGYDPAIPQEVGLYRMLLILSIKEAEKRGVILNDGSGATTAKINRGLVPHTEYFAVYERHLPVTRRLFWSSSALCMNTVLSFSKKKKAESALA